MIYRFLKAIAFVVCKLLFFIKFEGKDNRPSKGPYIVCCNHLHWIDPVFVGISIRQRVYFMGKEELIEKPVVGWLVKRLGMFAVRRGTGDMTALNEAEELVQRGKILGIFPEGTRSKTGELGMIKSGAVYVAQKTGANILPACVHFKGKVGIFHKVTLKYGEPIPAEVLSPPDLEDRKKLQHGKKVLKEAILALQEELNAD